MTKRIEYSCEICHRKSDDAHKFVGFVLDGTELSTKHPAQCNIHVCSKCLEGMARLVAAAGNKEEKAIAP